jgi:hypothetical protein
VLPPCPAPTFTFLLFQRLAIFRTSDIIKV